MNSNKGEGRGGLLERGRGGGGDRGFKVNPAGRG